MIGGRLRNIIINLRLPEVRATINLTLTHLLLTSLILIDLGMTTVVVNISLRPLLWSKLREERVFPATVAMLGVPGGTVISARVVDLTTRNRLQQNSENTLRTYQRTNGWGLTTRSYTSNFKMTQFKILLVD